MKKGFLLLFLYIINKTSSGYSPKTISNQDLSKIDFKCPAVPKSELSSIIKFLAHLSNSEQDKTSFNSLMNLLKFILAKEVDESKNPKSNLIKIPKQSLIVKSQGTVTNKTKTISDMPKSLIPIFKPKKNLHETISENIVNEALIAETPKPKRSKSRKKKTSKPKTQANSDAQPSMQKSQAVIDIEVDNVQTNISVTPVMNTGTFTIPCQTAADILSDTFENHLITQPQPTYQVIDNRSNFNPNPAEEVKSLNIQAQKIPAAAKDNNRNIRNQGDSGYNKEGVVVLLKPQTVSLKQCYGDYMKDVTMQVLLPFCVSKLV